MLEMVVLKRKQIVTWLFKGYRETQISASVDFSGSSGKPVDARLPVDHCHPCQELASPAFGLALNGLVNRFLVASRECPLCCDWDLREASLVNKRTNTIATHRHSRAFATVSIHSAVSEWASPSLPLLASAVRISISISGQQRALHWRRAA